jgi:hypothetical protein
MSDQARYLHVANGTSTTMTIEAAGIPGTCSIWADPLHEGPVPSGRSDSELVEVRRQFLAGPDGPVRPDPARPDPTRDRVNNLREWRTVIAHHESYDELILWFEHDVFDQLNLIQLLTWIRGHLPRTKPVSLICIGSFPGRPGFKGLGELTPDELAPLFDRRQPVEGSQYEVAERAWEAFRSPTPEALDSVWREDMSAMPYLAPAVSRFLQEYPWTRDGLSRTERRLLDLADGDGISLLRAFPRMHDGEQVYYVTDASLAAVVETLSRTTPPLLRFDLPAADDRRVWRGSVTLTDAGRSVLSGELDRVSACGIDRWLGGVHLKSGNRLWRWDETQQRII